MSLRPMTRAEFDEWQPRQVAGYAALIAASGVLPAQAAREKAERDTARYFGGGKATPGQHVFRVMAGEVAVGWLWLGVPGPDPDPLMAWHDVARAQRARPERRGQVALREPGVRGHRDADEEASLTFGAQSSRDSYRVDAHRTGV